MKSHLYYSVRKRYNLPETEKSFFNKEEMESIVESITGQPRPWTSVNSYMNDCLKEFGWLNQKTVDSHPNTSNLSWLLEHGREHNEIDYSKVSLSYLLEQMSTEFLSKMKTVELKKRTLTIEF